LGKGTKFVFLTSSIINASFITQKTVYFLSKNEYKKRQFLPFFTSKNYLKTHKKKK